VFARSVKKYTLIILAEILGFVLQRVLTIVKMEKKNTSVCSVIKDLLLTTVDVSLSNIARGSVFKKITVKIKAQIGKVEKLLISLDMP
jgi:nitrate/nitrite transporter NarK